MDALKVLSLGASKNIGYCTALRLLEQGATVTFQLRNPKCFDDDKDIQRYVQAGTARLVKGDATVENDVRKAWIEAGKGPREGDVDVLIFTVGGAPSGFGLRGFKMTPPDLCTRALLTAVRTLPPAQRAPGHTPRIIALSSIGITRASHKTLPAAYRFLYPTFIHEPHVDKTGMEHVAAHVSGRAWAPEDGDVVAKFVGADWKSAPGVPTEGEIPGVVVVRAAFLSDGPETGKYRVSATDQGKSFYTISRRDVAHFLVESVLKDWDAWKGKTPSVAN